MDRNEIELYLNGLLEVHRFRDYCPNGLQVQGREHITHIVTGVTASLALLDAAVSVQADAVLVHHGYFWKNEDARIVGQKHRRLSTLLRHDLNLFAYHLPLDSHPEFGNNASLARHLGLTPDGRFGAEDLGWSGRLPGEMALSELAAHVEALLQRVPLVIEGDGRPIRRIGWCTGGAQGFFESAIAAGVDLYISGEVSEQTTHLARETGVAYMAAGHHATERYGVQALGQHLAQQFSLRHTFIDIPNPV
jgi:dinuclear metal center YbgI/SA1388 family protein